MSFYLQNNKRLPPAIEFSGAGRAYPDISAIGQNVPVMWKGQLVMAGGTSASAPIVAGMISLLNGERLKIGKTPLGTPAPSKSTVLYIIITTTVKKQPLCGVIPRLHIPGAVPGGYLEYPDPLRGDLLTVVVILCILGSCSCWPSLLAEPVR